MKNVKKRKPRTKNVDKDFDGAHIFGQPCYWSTLTTEKLEHRLKNSLCLSCGKKECKCKSKS